MDDKWFEGVDNVAEDELRLKAKLSRSECWARLRWVDQ
jgi:hypothetical protein